MDAETWDKANEIYNDRQYKSGGQAKAKETYLLSGLIYCGLCGGAMCGNKVKSGRSKTLRITYKCNNRKAKKACTAKDIRKDLVENIVLDEVDRILSDDGIDEIVDYFTVKLKEMSKELPSEIKALKSELTKIENQINSMVNAIMDGLYSPTIKEKLSDLEKQKEDYINRINFYEKCNQATSAPSRQFIKDLICNDMNIKTKALRSKSASSGLMLKRL